MSLSSSQEGNMLHGVLEQFGLVADRLKLNEKLRLWRRRLASLARASIDSLTGALGGLILFLSTSYSLPPKPLFIVGFKPSFFSKCFCHALL